MSLVGIRASYFFKLAAPKFKILLIFLHSLPVIFEISDRRVNVHIDSDVTIRQATASTGDVQVVSADRLDLLQRDGKFTPSFARLHIFCDLGGGVLWCAIVLATLASR
jgi:hypothetical protein